MRSYAIYDDTGRVRRTYIGTEPELQLREGEGFIEGQVDQLSQRVNVKTGEVEDWQPDPPEPAGDYEWIERRWVKTAVAREREGRIAAARAQIAKLEAQQARPLRELALGDSSAVSRLDAIERQIAVHRRDLA